ncbi:follistatin-related protein 5 [Caerostris extrusa]|uniref:Follistatin-related protein 5 n=1 Tax=Caerostris extrusa TaxID=172846 RepID=A0AAV4QGZ0_CAEEX|nr:follistatin-related protein 5 [Caerostris extrusa]
MKAPTSKITPSLGHSLPSLSTTCLSPHSANSCSFDEIPFSMQWIPPTQVIGNGGCGRNTCGRWRSARPTPWANPSARATSTAKRGRSPCAVLTDATTPTTASCTGRRASRIQTSPSTTRGCASRKKNLLQETTTTDIETSAEDVSTSNIPLTTIATTDHRTDDPISWTNIPQPVPRIVGPSVPLTTVLPLTTMMSMNGDVDSELPPQRECSQQDYDFMKENLLLFNSAKLTDSKKPGNEYLVSIMFSHYDQNNNGQLEAEELWQAAERTILDNYPSPAFWRTCCCSTIPTETGACRSTSSISHSVCLSCHWTKP